MKWQYSGVDTMILHAFKRVDAEALAGPFRSCDWRHLEARALAVENRTPSPRMHDEATARLAHFYRKSRACRNQFDRRRLKRGDGEVFAAVELFNSTGDGGGLVAQALALANEPPEDIAGRIGVTTAAVSFFEDAYFDARSRLENRDFILNHVVRLGEENVDARELLRKAFLMFGYVSGGPAIDLLTGSPENLFPKLKVRDGLLLLAKRARALFEFDAISGQLMMDPNQSQRVRDIIKSIEEASGSYGDEDTPRTKVETVEAGLFAKMRGKPFTKRGT